MALVPVTTQEEPFSRLTLPKRSMEGQTPQKPEREASQKPAENPHQHHHHEAPATAAPTQTDYSTVPYSGSSVILPAAARKLLQENNPSALPTSATPSLKEIATALNQPVLVISGAANCMHTILQPYANSVNALGKALKPLGVRVVLLLSDNGANANQTVTHPTEDRAANYTVPVLADPGANTNGGAVPGVNRTGQVYLLTPQGERMVLNGKGDYPALFDKDFLKKLPPALNAMGMDIRALPSALEKVKLTNIGNGCVYQLP